MPQPYGLILAGGLATRMGGGDKALLPLGTGTILDFITERFAPQVDQFALNANGDHARWGNIGYPIVADCIGGDWGPLAGVLTAMRWAAKKGGSHIVTVAGDTPFFPCDLVPQLMMASDIQDCPIAMAVTQDRLHPTFALWPVNLADDLEADLHGGTRRVREWAETYGVAKAVFPKMHRDPFFNINTPDDLKQAQAML